MLKNAWPIFHLPLVSWMYYCRVFVIAVAKVSECLHYDSDSGRLKADLGGAPRPFGGLQMKNVKCACGNAENAIVLEMYAL